MTEKHKRIAPGAYHALREALPVVFWYKRPFESFVRTCLRDAPELLAGLNFGDLKRNVADGLVERLMTRESVYQQVAVELMLNVANMRRFPDLEKLEDGPTRVADAERAVAELRRWTEQIAGVVADEEKGKRELKAAREQADALRHFADDVEGLKQSFLRLHAATNTQERGRAFEGFLSTLFAVFDMEPRLAYSLEREEVDGSLSFDTDDYIVEARWRKEPSSREDADVFAAKVRRKGKNALGLFISVNGFSRDAIDAYNESTPFMAMDGLDLIHVLDQRVRLDDLLRRKKRYANETGACYFPASTLLEP
jgi:hypothetical protein